MRFMMWPFGTPRRPSQEKDYLIGTSCGSMSVADGACCSPPSGSGCVASRAAFRASTSRPSSTDIAEATKKAALVLVNEAIAAQPES